MDALGLALSAGCGGSVDLEDLEKLGTDSDSTMVFEKEMVPATWSGK